MVFDFNEQIKLGRVGERLLLKHWPDAVRRNADIKGVDFIDLHGRKIELKSDSYPMAKTPNFFFERFSSIESQSPGGPWQAVAKGATVLVYLFTKDRTWFVFEDLPRLLIELNALTRELPLKRVPNKGWVTGGYAVPRANVAHLYRETRLGNSGGVK